MATPSYPQICFMVMIVALACKSPPSRSSVQADPVAPPTFNRAQCYEGQVSLRDAELKVERLTAGKNKKALETAKEERRERRTKARAACEALATANGALGRRYGWTGPYEIYSNNCHHAANAGIVTWRDITGVLKCSDTTYYMGHAANYSIGKCVSGRDDCVSFCATEPQYEVDADPCCWEQPSGTLVNLLEGQGLVCTQMKCGAEASGSQYALGLGVPYAGDGPSNCMLRMFRNKSPSFQPSDQQRQECDACCTSQTARWASDTEEAAVEARKKFTAECRNLCVNAGKIIK